MSAAELSLPMLILPCEHTSSSMLAQSDETRVRGGHINKHWATVMQLLMRVARLLPCNSHKEE